MRFKVWVPQWGQSIDDALEIEAKTTRDAAEEYAAKAFRDDPCFDYLDCRVQEPLTGTESDVEIQVETVPSFVATKISRA